jgi:hypothetical protein
VNERQLLRRIRTVLLARRWENNSAYDEVFGRDSIKISMAPTDSGWDRLVMPAVILQPGQSQADDNDPSLYELDLTAYLFVFHAGDDFGEAALMGAHRSSIGTAQGRGLLEVQTEVLAAISRMGAKDNVYVRNVASGVSRPESTEQGYLLARSLNFKALVGVEPIYSKPNSFTAVQVGDDVVLTWTAPDADETNGDLTNYEIRKISGSVHGAYETDGDAIALGAPLDVTVTDSAPGAGTYTYSVFAEYADEGGSIVQHYSDCRYATVTVT